MPLPVTPELEEARDIVDAVDSGDIDLGDAVIKAMRADGIVLKSDDLPLVTIHLLAEFIRRR